MVMDEFNDPDTRDHTPLGYDVRADLKLLCGPGDGCTSFLLKSYNGDMMGRRC